MKIDFPISDMVEQINELIIELDRLNSTLNVMHFHDENTYELDDVRFEFLRLTLVEGKPKKLQYIYIVDPVTQLTVTVLNLHGDSTFVPGPWWTHIECSIIPALRETLASKKAEIRLADEAITKRRAQEAQNTRDAWTRKYTKTETYR